MANVRSPARRLAEQFKTTRRIGDMALVAADQAATEAVEEGLDPIDDLIAALVVRLTDLENEVERQSIVIATLLDNQAKAARAVEVRVEAITRAHVASLMRNSTAIEDAG